MMPQRSLKVSQLLLACVLLAGCSDVSDTFNEFDRLYKDRWGPDPNLKADDFGAIAIQQHKVMQSFIGADTAIYQILPEPSDHSYWKKVTDIGMNVIDQKCDQYMSDLFKLSREHDRNDTILKSIANTSAAIVAGAVSSRNSKIPLLAIGQAFGLVESVQDAAIKSYLFEQVPSVISVKVKVARNLYRSAIEPVSPKDSIIQDETASYRALRDYLNLCMPQTIEANFVNTYTASTPVVQSQDKSTTPKQQNVADVKPKTTTQSLNFMITQVQQ